MADERFPEDSFEAFLLKSRLVGSAYVQAALRRRKEKGDDLGVNLVEVGGLCEADLARCLSVFHQRLAVTLSDVEGAPREAVALLPAEVALRLRVCPVALAGNALKVCATRPLSAEAAAELERVTSCKVSQAIATPIAVAMGLARHYGAAAPPRYLRLLGRDGASPEPPPSLPAAESGRGSDYVFALDDTLGGDAPDGPGGAARPAPASDVALDAAGTGSTGPAPAATSVDAAPLARRKALRAVAAVAVFAVLAAAAAVVLLSDLGRKTPGAPSRAPSETAAVAVSSPDAFPAAVPAHDASSGAGADGSPEEWVTLSLPPSCPPDTVVFYDGARATSLPMVVRRQRGSVPVIVRPPGFREEKLLVIPDHDQELAVQLLPLEAPDAAHTTSDTPDATATVAAAEPDAGKDASSSRTTRTAPGARDRTATAAGSVADAATAGSPPAFFTPDLPELPDRDAVASAFESVRGGVRVCLHWPERAVTVDVVISGETGKPTFVGTRAEISPQTAACVEAVIRRLTFPKFRRPSVRVSFLYQY